MEDKKASGPGCSGCPQLGIIIGNDGRRFWCFEYNVDLLSKNEKCVECLKNMPEE